MKTTTNWAKGEVSSLQAQEGITKHWRFKESEEDELKLAYYMGQVAEKNGMSANDLQHLFPAVLRMLKSKSEWA